VLGTIAAITVDARPLVRFDGAPGPTIARVGSVWESGSPTEASVGTQVILIFENGDPDLPIITGFVGDSLRSGKSAPVDATNPDGSNRSSDLRGRKVTLEGTEEVVLRCGLASITIRADGQVVIKGTRLTSKASETNKIRGSSVLIN